MKNSAAAAILATFAIGAFLDAAFAQQIRRWVDDDGVVHYGQYVPPEYANRDRQVLNSQGVAVGFEKGQLTDEERAQANRATVEDNARQLEAEETARRDKVLLDTYLSVEDIEALRDRRLELMESQIKVTEQYLASLRNRLGELQREAERHARAAQQEDAEIPPELALDISRTSASIALYEENLTRARTEQSELHAAFAADITRFIELKSRQSGGAL